MGIRLVIFDCDLTLWDHRNVSGLRLPFRKVDAEAVADADGVQVRLFPSVREVLASLNDQGPLMSADSSNQPEHDFEIPDFLGLSDYFTRPNVEPHTYKMGT